MRGPPARPPAARLAGWDLKLDMKSFAPKEDQQISQVATSTKCVGQIQEQSANTKLLREFLTAVAWLHNPDKTDEQRTTNKNQEKPGNKQNEYFWLFLVFLGFYSCRNLARKPGHGVGNPLCNCLAPRRLSSLQRLEVSVLFTMGGVRVSGGDVRAGRHGVRYFGCQLTPVDFHSIICWAPGCVPDPHN